MGHFEKGGVQHVSRQRARNSRLPMNDASRRVENRPITDRQSCRLY